MNTAALSSALLSKDEPAQAPGAADLVQVAKSFGVSPLRQMRDILTLRFSPGKLSARDYYENRLFDPQMTRAEKLEFVSARAGQSLNERLSPPETVHTGTFVSNKVLHGALLRQLGLRVPETLAVVTGSGAYGRIEALRDTGAVRAFLSRQDIYPLFGKPVDGSLSVGSVMIRGLEDDGETLVIANGSRRPLNAFCEEVVNSYGKGYVFQRALSPHPDVRPVTGETTGALRLVTVMSGRAPTLAYGLWKIPATQAMSDNFWQSGSMIAGVDMATGVVTRCRQGVGLATRDITRHPDNGSQITGLHLPGFDAACALAREAHAILPDVGVCGWDIGLTDNGPVIIECNNSPFHTLYQLAYGRGVLNPDLMPLWDETITRQKSRLKTMRLAGKRKL